MSRDLPYPVAVQFGRAHNAKSPKERHDTAYFAWEASIKLALAARPPADPGPLARGSLGNWVAALRVSDTILVDASILTCFRLFSDQPPSAAVGKKSVSVKDLLDTLPAYRNRVIGHGSIRDSAYYEEAAGILLEGLTAAWRNEVFLDRAARLVFVESIELDPAGVRRARILDLTGEFGRIVDPHGTAGIPDEVLPRRIYLRTENEYRSLHPWLLVQESEPLHRVFFFNGLGRTPQYLDYVSGEILKGPALGALHPAATGDVSALFQVSPAEEAEPGEADEEAPDRIGDFRLLEKLGEGGMGIVHLARQESLGRLVAIKTLPRDLANNPVAVARFRQEIDSLSRCEHRNVVKILMSGKTRSTHYYAMEYVEGVNLDRLGGALSTCPDFDSAVSAATQAAKSGEKVVPADAIPAEHLDREPEAAKPPSRDLVRRLAVLLAEAARGIDHLHEHGVIHRDVKPGNLMVTVGDHRTVVMDLGLAKLREATESITIDRSRILGTLRYIPPEQLQQHVRPIDQRVDVYSLGATFYELMTGRPIFDGNTEARLIEQVLLEEPRHPRKVNPAIPRDLSTILRKSVDKDPRLRYPSAADFAEDVERFLADRPIAAQPPTPFYLLALAVKRNKPLAATVAAAFVVVLAALLLFAVSQGALARAEKEKRLSMAVRLDLAQSRNLIAEMNEPVPLHPDSLEKLKLWIRSTRTLLERRGEFQRMLESGESADGTPVLPQDVARVVSSIDRLTALLPLARDDQKRVEAVLDARARQHETWPAAIRGIALSPAYESLGAIQPQLGLVPLRENPKTHLWEFWHVASGARPPMDAKTGEPRITPASGIVLVLLPGGSYMMGAPPGEPNRQEVERYHEEHVEPFFIAKHEVTQAQWERAMRTNPAYYPPGSNKGAHHATGANPVEVVSWLDCRRFERRLVLRLPTEAEWEYACRGGTTTPYLTGETYESLRMKENLKDRSLAQLRVVGFRLAPWNDGHQIHAPVGSFAPNRFGLYDMQGNVSEWTADEYVDPAIPPPGRRRVFRGANFMMHPQAARSAQRQWNGEATAINIIGARVARDLDR